DAHEHVERVLDIVSLFNILGVTHDAVMLRVFPITLTRAAKRWVDRLSLGSVDSWDLLKKAFIQRYNDLLYKCPTHEINSHQKVNIFYNGLGTMNFQLLDSQGPIPSMTPAQALTAIQTMANHSQKWHDDSSSRNIGSSSNSEGIAAIVRAHLDKECPLNEEVKSVEEVKYSEFGRHPPFNAYYEVETQIEQLTKEFHAKTTSEVPNSSVDQCKVLYANNEAPIDNTSANESNGVSFIVNDDVHTGASVNVIPKFMFKHLKLANLKKTNMLVEMADMTKRAPIEIVENILVKIDKFLFPSDLVVIDTSKTRNETMILGRPFLATIHAEIDVFNKKISLGIGDDRVTFDMDKQIHNFTTPVGKVYMVISIHNNEPPNLLDISSKAQSYESS
ncbi:hypothetical protein Tco_0775368, partial [Tanacetum coccineum]